jgi:hypothetical protein
MRSISACDERQYADRSGHRTKSLINDGLAITMAAVFLIADEREPPSSRFPTA